MSKKTRSTEHRIKKLLAKIEHWQERLDNEDLHGKRKRIKRSIYFKRRTIEYLNYLYLLGVN